VVWVGLTFNVWFGIAINSLIAAGLMTNAAADDALAGDNGRPEGGES
jgi:hypothetical protein